jgi:hypothetical protein
MVRAGLRVLLRKGPFAVQLLPPKPWWRCGWIDTTSTS